MSEKRKINRDQRLTAKQKNANNKQWYKDQADRLDNEHYRLNDAFGGISEYRKMKVNYDLFNNVLNLSDFSHVCEPFGEGVGELPAKMANRDIVSGKIKALLGMEMKRPFPWAVEATNPEATTRREQEEAKRIREYVESMIMTPIRQNIEMKYQEQIKGQELTDEEKQKIQQQIAEELKAQTPPEVKKYMKRDHQDPAEILASQLLQYLINKTDIKRKFNEAFKHLHLSAREVLYVGIFRGEPEVWNVNSLRFNHHLASDQQFIEDSEWASCEYRMTPSDIVRIFGDELTDTQIDDIYELHTSYNINEERLFDFSNNVEYDDNDDNTIRVLHTVWKSLRRVGFLKYMGSDGLEQETLVFEDYTLNTDAGDIEIEWEWIPEVYETWKIHTDMYVKMQPVPGQFKDLDNMYNAKLPYYGAVCDNTNSRPTSVMDRLRIYQYYYNIIMYRVELLMASDKGKKVLMNINAIPNSLGIDVEKWQYFLESSGIMWYNPDEEGKNQGDVNSLAKTIDLSLASDINRYIELAEYIKNQAGASVGITPQVEGQIGPNESVSNTRQSLVQTSHILEPYFDLHNHVKRNVLQALIETAKVAYSISQPKKLTYFLDDMSREIINMDIGLLDNSTFGIFLSNSSKAEETKEVLRNLTHAALQNQKVELSDVISVLRQESIPEAEETLKVAEDTRREFEQSSQQQAQQAQAEEAEKQRNFEREKHEMEKEKIVLKEEEKRKTEVTKAGIMAASFNPDQDVDNDGVNDFIEIARDGIKADIKREEIQLNREKLEHDKIMDKKKLELEEKKINKESKNKKK